MTEMVIFGTGNVATHLFQRFYDSKNVRVKQIFNHSPESLEPFRSKTETITSIEDLADADIYLLALKDDVIEKVASGIKKQDRLVVHTSGAASINILEKFPHRGVFYPLQTFSKNLDLIFPEIPFCLEAAKEEDLKILENLAGEISKKHYHISSEQRKKLHLAAVFVCNFVNHLYSIGEDICSKNEVPFEVLQPLIQETSKKILNSSPFKVQTGPAIREDQSTIETHLDLLKNGDQKEIYRLLTKAIQTSHGKKL